MSIKHIQNDHPKTVLIIDDEDSIRDVLVNFFDELGYHILTARDGRGGVTEFKNNSVDLVITDIVMPREEGIGTIREIRKQSKSVKIIAMTGFVGSYLQEAITLGADDSIGKPFTSEELMSVIERVSRS